MSGAQQDLEGIALDSARLAVVLQRLRTPASADEQDAAQPSPAVGSVARAIQALEVAVRALRDTVSIATPPHDDRAYRQSVRRAYLTTVGTCVIDLSLRGDGSLVFEGEDSGPAAGGGTYEYQVFVRAAYLPVVRAELGGDAEANLFDLVLANGDRIATKGELAWLRGIGLDPGFTSWRGGL